MALHQRQKIRDAVVDILLNKTDAGSYVSPGQMTPVWGENTPAILVYDKDEVITVFDESPRRWKRDLTLVLEIYAQGETEKAATDTLDTISLQVEQEMTRYDDLKCTCSDWFLQAVHKELSEVANKPSGALIMTFLVEYLEQQPVAIEEQPEAECTAFTGADVDWDLGPEPDDSLEAEDEIDLPQS